jgi:thermitase
MGRIPAVAICVLGLIAANACVAEAAGPESHQVIVKYSADASARQRSALMHRSGATATVGRVLGVGAAVVRVRRDPDLVAARLNRSRLVEYAEPNRTLRAAWFPNDPRFHDLYGLHNTGQTGGSADADIDAPEAWQAAGLGGWPSAGGVRVGIVDTGIDQTHPDLSGQTVACASALTSGPVEPGACPDGDGHGTHVAGTIAAKANNGIGIAGVAFNADLVVCKALDDDGVGSLADVASCIGWVRAEGAKVISLSLEGGPSQTLQDAVVAAWSNGNGALVVAAAGNEGDGTLAYPAAYPDAVSVAATDSRDAHADFSNVNADVEIAAPGVDVLSTVPGGGYELLSGTSMATPHVSGAAAVLWQHFPADSALAIRMRLDGTTDDLGPAGRDSTFGFGRVNLCRALHGFC